MIQECLEIFQKNLEQYGDAYVLDNYVPKDGTYLFIVMRNENWEVKEPLEIIYDQKKNMIKGKSSPQYPDFCFLDYYSKLIAMNKPVDTKKKIHSNNYYTFFIKKESLSDPGFSQEVIDNYYAVLKEPRRKYKKANALELYQQIEERLGSVEETEIEQIRSWITANLHNLHVDTERKDYLKLFFVYPDMENTRNAYMRENQRYMLPNIYNNNDFNQIINGKIMGLPNDNLNMNSKKPYLAHHSRRMPIPYLLDLEDALLQARFYDFLMGCASKGYVNIYFNNRSSQITACRSGEYPESELYGYFLRIKKGKEVEIHNADTVVCYNPNLSPVFYHKEIIKSDRNDYGLVNKRAEMERLVDELFFNKSLTANYFTDPANLMIRDGTVLNQIVAVREQLFVWFYKNDGITIWPLMKTTGLTLVKHSISVGYWKKAKNQINLLWSLEDYFMKNNRREKRMEQVTEKLWNHINDKSEWRYSSDEEYYFAVGQLVSYFISKSNSKKKPLSFVNPFLNAQNDEIIKKHLGFLFKKYNYGIEYKDMRVKRLYSNAMLYHPQSQKVDINMLSAGVTANNFIFMKSEEATVDSTAKDQEEQG